MPNSIKKLRGSESNEPADSNQSQAAGDDEGGDVCPECKERRDWFRAVFGYNPRTGAHTPFCNHCGSTGKLSIAVTRRLTGEYDSNFDCPF
jgi:hypothetical protein